MNPNAGTAGDAEAVRKGLRRLGDVTFYITEHPGDAQRLAREAVASGSDLVVAAGVMARSTRW